MLGIPACSSTLMQPTHNVTQTISYYHVGLLYHTYIVVIIIIDDFKDKMETRLDTALRQMSHEIGELKSKIDGSLVERSQLVSIQIAMHSLST